MKKYFTLKIFKYIDFYYLLNKKSSAIEWYFIIISLSAIHKTKHNTTKLNFQKYNKKFKSNTKYTSMITK